MERKELTKEDLEFVESNPNNAASGVNDNVQLDIWIREEDTIVGIQDKNTGKYTGEFWKYDGKPDPLDIQAAYIDLITPAEDAGTVDGDATPTTADPSEAGAPDENTSFDENDARYS